MHDQTTSNTHHPLTLQFADRRQERAFLDWHSANAAQYQRVAGFAGSVMFVLAWFWIHWLAPDLDSVAIKLIAFVAVPALMGTFAFSFVTMPDWQRQWLIVVDMVACGITVFGFLLFAPTPMNSPLSDKPYIVFQYMGVPALMLILVVTTTFIRQRFVYALVTLPTSLVVYAAVANHAETPGIILYNNLIIFGGVAILSLTLAYIFEFSLRREFVQTQELAGERDRSEGLLLNILPSTIAEQLKTDNQTIADRYDHVTVLFADLVGFTQLSARLSAEEVVNLLNRVFTEFDRMTETFGMEKIKTIGDAYMVASGVPDADPDHAVKSVQMAIAMLETVQRLAAETGEELSMRIGINSGDVVAGVIGVKKFIYDLWGDAVNIASRMESHGVAGRIQVSHATWELVRDHFAFGEQRTVEVKGKGPVQAWILDLPGS